VGGRGVERLREAGIEVIEVGGDALEDLDPGYFHHRRTGRPRVTLKTALTLDGQVAAADRSSQWITSEAARADGHRLRAVSDAVLVGAGTVIADDPKLDVRLPDHAGPQPQPVVVLGRRSVPSDAQVLSRSPLVYSTGQSDIDAESVVLAGVDGVDLMAVMKDLGSRGFVDVLVEGGPTLAASLVRDNLIDRFVFYYGAKLAGGVGLGAFAAPFDSLGAATDLEIMQVARLGSDIRIDAIRVGGS